MEQGEGTISGQRNRNTSTKLSSQSLRHNMRKSKIELNKLPVIKD